MKLTETGKDAIMIRTCLILISLIFAVSQPVFADEVSHRKSAKELLELMDVKTNFERSMDSIKQVQMAQLSNMGLSDMEIEKAKALQEKIMNLIANEMSWDKFRDDLVIIYMDTFTEEELNGIVEFYRSPAGQKFIEKVPEIMSRSMQLSQQIMADMMPKIQKITEEFMASEKVAPDSPEGK